MTCLEKSKRGKNLFLNYLLKMKRNLKLKQNLRRRFDFEQSALDDWFLRQDILDQLMSQDEEASEAERYADRIMRIAQEDSAEHQVLSDPFDRSVALVLSLVKEEGMDPWNIDLSAFLKLFTQRVRKEAAGLDLPACGRLIRMSWEVLTQQASTLFDRVIARILKMRMILLTLDGNQSMMTRNSFSQQQCLRVLQIITYLVFGRECDVTRRPSTLGSCFPH